MNVISNTSINNYNDLQPRNKVTNTSENSIYSSFIDNSSISNNFQLSTSASAALKASVLTQTPVGYKEIKTFNVPNIGKGKLLQLNNGHKVIIIPKSGPTSIMNYLKTGYLNDPIGKKGLAYFMNHILYTVNQNLADEKDKLYYQNTEIASNTTSFYIKNPINNKSELENNISFLSKSLLTPNFDESAISRAKSIILSELNIIKNDNPYCKCQRAHFQNLFGITCDDNAHFAIGSKRTLDNITKQDLINYYKTNYNPSNMTTIIIGDAKSADVMPLMVKYFGKIQDKKVDKGYSPEIKPISKTKKTYVTGPKPSISIAIANPFTGNEKERTTCELIAYALECQNDINSIKSIYTPSALSCGFETIACGDTKESILSIDAPVKKGKLNEMVHVNAISKIFKAMKEKPLSPNELQYLKDKLKNDQSKKYEDCLELSKDIKSSYSLTGNINAFDQKISAIDSITPQDIQQMAQKTLNTDKMSIVVTRPAKNSAVSFKGNIPQIDMSDVKESTLPNNLKFVTNTSSSNTRSFIIFNVENYKMPDAKLAVYQIFNAMNANGTGNFDKNHIENFKKVNFIDGDMRAMNHSIIARISCPADKTSNALRFATDMIFNPNMTQKNFDEAKALLKKTIKPQITDKSLNPKFSDEEMIQDFFDKQNLSGYFAQLLKDIDNVTFKDVQDYHNNLVKGAHGYCIMSMPKDEFNNEQAHISDILRKVPELKPFSPNTRQAAKPENKIYVKTQEQPQVSITQLFVTSDFKNIKDDASLSLLATILKQKLSNCRTNKTFYSALSSCNYSQEYNKAMLFLNIDTDIKNNPENLPKILDELKENIKQLKDEPMPEEELNKAKQKLLNTMLAQRETGVAKCNLLEYGIHSCHGTDLENQKIKAIESLTSDDIQNAAKHFLDKPSATSIIANSSTVDKNKNYFDTMDEVIKI